MSFIQDLIKENIKIDYAENFSYYNSLDNKELKNLLRGYLSCNLYKPDGYTPIIKSILKQAKFSPDQRKALVIHLCEHEGDIG